jgi:hypothetical protein
MDPITAVALAVKATAEMVTEIVKGQPPDVRAQAWQWWMEDTKFWRDLLKPKS